MRFMLNWGRQRLVLVCGLCFSLVAPLCAEDVSIPFNGLILNANLELSDGKSLQDEVVLLVHGNMAHNDLEIIRSSQAAFKYNGYNSLAINLSLEVDNRRGMYDCSIPIRYKLSESIDEFDAWLDWLYSQGTSKVIMMGHSLSANLILLHAVERQNKLVSAVVLLAPNTTGFPASSERYNETYGVNLYEILARAKRLVKAGEGKQIMENTDYGFCPRTQVSAEAFVDFYQQDSNLWQAHHFLKSSPVPTLVVAGSIDEFQPFIVEHVEPYVDNEKVWLSTIEGADHLFRDFNIDEAVEVSIDFLSSVASLKN